MRDIVLFVVWISAAAVWLFTHVLLLIRTARSPRLSPIERALAWLPPLTAFFSWKAGARGGAVVWAASAALYLVSRSVE